MPPKSNTSSRWLYQNLLCIEGHQCPCYRHTGDRITLLFACAAHYLGKAAKNGNKNIPY